MNHLLYGPLPGCATLEEAESNHRLEAMRTELRNRRTQTDHRVSIKEIERHFDELKVTDKDVYVTCLYTSARSGVVCGDLTDNQLRRALNGESLAVAKLYCDHDVIRPAVHLFRREDGAVSEGITENVRRRIESLLPAMIEITHEEARKDIPVRYQKRYGSRGEERIALPAEESLSPVIAEAMLRLRVLCYLRHPVDLLREITAWEVDMEHSE